MDKKLTHRFTLVMPNGTLVSVPVYEGKSVKEKINNHVV